ncbi:hypothetical protein SAMD00019534_092930 [Acytostelium subglobosum LB1]|uniref:hypothetical protein n=1 Tax=Acytostelium subglobosum LB1 TaxID=1410327 RepID=UPI0006450B79|nr:hypothetical protein SAMD00019534_092930 [Acytostelium subglobosum LB1]GAM26118.1 hypothetical protein SAMD00019534_092930 [Acytostelium subglobosum LB1]|eukprot:XP_012751161.1 hypothetical protein SAMD00019534_092930 [Acytostelium subglobosum LB1]
MGLQVFVYSLLAGLTPLVSASLPLFLFRNGINARYYQLLLAMSAGILFAVATLELLPEAMEMSTITTTNNNIIKIDNDRLNNNTMLTTNLTMTTTTTMATTTGHSGHDEDEDEHGSGARIPMYGLALGFIMLIGIELLMSSAGHSHSHSHSVDSSSNNNANDGDNHDDHSIEMEERDKKDETHEPDTHEHLDEEEGGRHSLISNNGEQRSSLGGGQPPVVVQQASKLSMTAFVALSVHSLVDGMVISGAFAANSDVGARVAMAIVIHKLPDGFVMSSIVLSQRKLLGFHPFLYFLLISCMTPLGSFIASIILGGINPSTVSFILGFGAGTFLYITTTGILPEILHAKRANKPMNIGAICLGYLTFIVIDSLVHVH